MTVEQDVKTSATEAPQDMTVKQEQRDDLDASGSGVADPLLKAKKEMVMTCASAYDNERLEMIQAMSVRMRAEKQDDEEHLDAEMKQAEQKVLEKKAELLRAQKLAEAALKQADNGRSAASSQSLLQKMHAAEENLSAPITPPWKKADRDTMCMEQVWWERHLEKTAQSASQAETKQDAGPETACNDDAAKAETLAAKAEPSGADWFCSMCTCKLERIQKQQCRDCGVLLCLACIDQHNCKPPKMSAARTRRARKLRNAPEKQAEYHQQKKFRKEKKALTTMFGTTEDPEQNEGGATGSGTPRLGSGGIS